MVAKPNLLHDTIDGPLAGNTDAFRLFYEKRLMHTDSSISIVTFIF